MVDCLSVTAAVFEKAVVNGVGLGFENYGDHSSRGYIEGASLWDNNEYDLPAGSMVHFVRTVIEMIIHVSFCNFLATTTTEETPKLTNSLVFSQLTTFSSPIATFHLGYILTSSLSRIIVQADHIHIFDHITYSVVGIYIIHRDSANWAFIGGYL